MNTTCIVTGGAGFIGSNFVHMLAEIRPDWAIVNLDALTYAGNRENLQAVENKKNYVFVHGDITQVADVEKAFAEAAKFGGRIVVVHFAAESHVDRSIQSGVPFVNTNVVGTQILLDASRAHDDCVTARERARFRELGPIARTEIAHCDLDDLLRRLSG